MIGWLFWYLTNSWRCSRICWTVIIGANGVEHELTNATLPRCKHLTYCTVGDVDGLGGVGLFVGGRVYLQVVSAKQT
jgi:hypothetical protein